ncbi:MAG: FMN-binding negative transcriptional regulator [Allopontixanthobacter sediminis]
MHPIRAFRDEDRRLHEALIDQIGFGMIFAQTPLGPRVAHTPLISTGDGALQFHLAVGNDLTQHLPGNTALAVVNGPDAYVSARWYSQPDQVPTWNYVALELEGHVRRMEEEGLSALLQQLVDRQEARVTEGQPWTMDKLSPARLTGLLKGIVGFEMEIGSWRETVKLSQNKWAAERERVARGLDSAGANGIARLMRDLVS